MAKGPGLNLCTLILCLLPGLTIQSFRQRRQGFDVGRGNPCRTPRNVGGVCISIKDCPLHLDYLVNRRDDPAVVRYLQDALCRKQVSQIFTCCPVDKSGVNFASGGGGGSRGDCQTPRQTAGECINIRQCPELVDMLRRNKEPGVTQYLRASQCGFDNNTPKVCCPLQGQQFDGGENQASEGNTLPGNDVCGISDVQGTRIVNGKPANLGSWPWMVALGYRSSKKPREWLCGGTLISSKFVITAAHCVTNIGNRVLYLARLGDLNLNDTITDGATPVDMQVERSIAHENYNAAKHTVDIALVKLKEPAQFTKFIRPICVPTSTTFRDDLTGYSPFVIGWGATEYRGPATTALQEAQITVTDQTECENAYRNIKGATIDNRVICALSDGGQDACQGDSGGPLILPKKTTFYLIGLVSYGYKCAEPGYPGVYTKMSLYTDWITKNMRT